MAGLPQRLLDLRRALSAEKVSLSDIPVSFKDRQIATDGRARLEVIPKGDMRERVQLTTFVTAVQKLAPDATGNPVVIMEGGDAVVGAFIEAAVLSVGLIAILVIYLTRGIREIILIFTPLLLAALFTLSASVMFNLPFNFANVIVLPLLFGLGIASGIHLVLRERHQKNPHDMIRTSTPRAIFFSALTTIGSFGSIALSSHPGTSSMGILLTIAITLSLICTLGVLPAFMALWQRSTP
ncbi:MAG: MMPL family transporter [Rhodospirillales bacterium]|nr:MMPL family transporter [Rhodospirillales bacterium]